MKYSRSRSTHKYSESFLVCLLRLNEAEIQRVFPGCVSVLQEVVFREDSEKGGLGVAQRSCFGVQGSCFLSSLSEGTKTPSSLFFCPSDCCLSCLVV